MSTPKPAGAEIKILYSTHTAAHYMPPLSLSARQIIVGPDYPDVRDGGRIRSIQVAPGHHDLGALVRALPKEQVPDLTVVLIDSYQRCVPGNLAAVPGRKLLFIADTHHGEAPLQKCLAYARQEPFDRIAVIHDPHHLHWFTEANIAPATYIPNVNVAAFDQPFQEQRRRQIAFVGQSGKWHPRRQRLLQAIQRAGLPLTVQQVPAPLAAQIYSASQINFNCSLNGDLNMRCFEVLSAGGLLMTDRLSPQSGLETLFRRGEHYVDYENEQDLLLKLDYYLAHPQECLAIARAGRQAFLDHHRPAQRIRDVLAFAFGDGAVPLPRDRRALPGQDGFGHDLEARVRLYEMCQTFSLRQERALVVIDATLGARTISDLVDLPRLKIFVATDGQPHTALKDALHRLGVLDQVEFIDDGSIACDLRVDIQSFASGRSGVPSA